MTINKKIAIGIIVAVILIFGVIIGWIFLSKKESLIPEEIIEEETITETERQLRELEELRKEAPSLTEEEIKSQAEELEKLLHKTQPLSQEEAQKQLEELEKLRQ